MDKARIKTDKFVSYYHKVMRNRGKSRRVIKDYREVLDLLSVIYETIKEHYLNNQGGVYIDKLGYLCHMIRPKQSFGINRMVNDVFRGKTEGFKYQHISLDSFGAKNPYHLDIQQSLKKESRIMMNDGKRYKFLYREVMTKCYKKRGRRVYKIFTKGELK